MWMTGIHSNSDSTGNYQSSSPNVNLKIKTPRALSFLIISLLLVIHVFVTSLGLF